LISRRYLFLRYIVLPFLSAKWSGRRRVHLLGIVGQHILGENHCSHAVFRHDKAESRGLLKPYSGFHPYPDEVCAGSGFVPGIGLLSWACPHAVNRGGYRHWGGADGEGVSPSPVSNSRRSTHFVDPARPPASSPAPRAGAVMAIPGGKLCPGVPSVAAIWNKLVEFQQSRGSIFTFGSTKRLLTA